MRSSSKSLVQFRAFNSREITGGSEEAGNSKQEGKVNAVKDDTESHE